MVSMVFFTAEWQSPQSWVDAQKWVTLYRTELVSLGEGSELNWSLWEGSYRSGGVALIDGVLEVSTQLIKCNYLEEMQ